VEPPADRFNLLQVRRSGQHRDQADKHWRGNHPVGFTRLHVTVQPTAGSVDGGAAGRPAPGATLLLGLGSALALTPHIRAVRLMVAVPMVHREKSCTTPAIPCRSHVHQRLPAQAPVSKKMEAEEGRRA
jgi:hypothetical protein